MNYYYIATLSYCKVVLAENKEEALKQFPDYFKDKIIIFRLANDAEIASNYKTGQV